MRSMVNDIDLTYIGQYIDRVTGESIISFYDNVNGMTVVRKLKYSTNSKPYVQYLKNKRFLHSMYKGSNHGTE